MHVSFVSPTEASLGVGPKVSLQREVLRRNLKEESNVVGEEPSKLSEPYALYEADARCNFHSLQCKVSAP